MGEQVACPHGILHHMLTMAWAGNDQGLEMIRKPPLACFLTREVRMRSSVPQITVAKPPEHSHYLLIACHLFVPRANFQAALGVCIITQSLLLTCQF